MKNVIIAAYARSRLLPPTNVNWRLLEQMICPLRLSNN